MTDIETRTVSLPARIAQMVQAHAAEHRLGFDAALAQLAALGFASAPLQEVDPGRMNFTFAVPAPAATAPDDDLADLADPNAGQLVEADDGRTLRVGAFYWVLPVMDPDTPAGMGWMDEEQPARFAGRNAKGKLLWHVLALEGDEAHDASSWPMRFIGDEIVRPGP